MVVPTSVMVNWEMEIKKFAPAFKIMCYFGSQKERKMKRQVYLYTLYFILLYFILYTNAR